MSDTIFMKVEDVRAGKISERRISYDPIAELREKIFRTAAQRSKMDNLLESFVLTPDAGNMLRDGIRYLAFNAYSEMPQTFGSFATSIPSNKPSEEYLRDAVMGTLPRVESGSEAPRIQSAFEGGVKIENHRYAGIVEVTGDDLRFDRLGKMKQIAPELGRSARMTEEAAVYAVLTTAANYVRNSTTGDNDVGANTSALTFNALGIEQAYATIATSKDRRSGSYLGLIPDTLIVGPRMQWAVKQLLLADSIVRAGGSATNEVRGTGETPIYRGLITNVIVSPWFPTGTTGYQWALIDSKRLGVVFQQVEPFNILQEGMSETSETWLTRNTLRWLAQGYFGTGIVDDRPLFYSSSTTAPTIS